MLSLVWVLYMYSTYIFVTANDAQDHVVPHEDGQVLSQTDIAAIKQELSFLKKRVANLEQRVKRIRNNGSRDSSYNPDSKQTVSFSASLSSLINLPKRNYVIPFDNVLTNIGKGYNSTSGEFVAPSDGVYSFTWIMGLTWKTLLCTALRVNDEIVGRTFGSTSFDSFGAQMTSGCISTCLKIGDVVTVTTCENINVIGMILSDIYRTCTFNGFRIGDCI